MMENAETIVEKYDKKEKEKIKEAENVAQAYLVVATLITTITFAAVITLPGGFEEGDDQHPALQFSWEVLLLKRALFSMLYQWCRLVTQSSFTYSSQDYLYLYLTVTVASAFYRQLCSLLCLPWEQWCLHLPRVHMLF